MHIFTITAIIQTISLSLLNNIVICQDIYGFDSDLQFHQVDLNISDEDFKSEKRNDVVSEEKCLSYGLWSKYAPLSSIKQVGDIGLFDSNCFHYMNAADRETNRINMIYYDCLDYKQRTITKIVEFIDDQFKFHKYEMNVKNDEYEGVWFLFYMIIWPQLQKFKMILSSVKGENIYEEQSLKYPFYDKELTITFGGGLEAYYNENRLKYSYFPGKLLMVSDFDKFEIRQVSPEYSLFDLIHSDGIEFDCKNNDVIQLIGSQKFQQQEQFIFTSEFPNINYFQLIGWIRIIEVTNLKSDLIYQIMNIGVNSQDDRLKCEDLSTFQLFYKIYNSDQSIIFTTYNYTFPTVNLYAINERFLITNEFKLINNISNWHYLSIKLLENQLIVEIQFYENQISQLYSKSLNVKQFSMVNFHLKFGNIAQSLDNYLQLEMAMIQFSICNSAILQKCLNQDCSECSGPTNNDCSSCFLETKKVYSPLKKQCICLFYTTKADSCLDLSDLQLSVIESEEEITLCPFGYFTVNLECFSCPSIIREGQITCLECLINPFKWIDMLYCSSQLISFNRDTFTYETFDKIYYIFNGVELNYCSYCTEICQDDNCINTNYQKITTNNELKCAFTSAFDSEHCFYCDLNGCLACSFSIFKGNYCIHCQSMYILVNGKCIYGQDYEYCFENCRYCSKQICSACYQPYYLNHDKSQCKVCQIQNCKYCFEFKSNDRAYNTIFKEFQQFEIDEYFSIGCSQCYDGYNYDFTLKQCIKGFPEIQNCVRSYKEESGEEKCLLSAIDDFNISPQIINCQGHIQNCEQCLITQSGMLKCIICQPGFGSSQINGTCEKCQLQNTKNCLQGDSQLGDFWVQLIQSFIVQFFSNSYQYPAPGLAFLHNFSLSCDDGYQVSNINGQCIQYCDKNCLKCEFSSSKNEFQCKQCPKNQQGISNLSNNGKNCLECSKLCLICQSRSEQDTKNINPQFVITNENRIYTNICPMPITDQKVKIDQITQIAYYCFDQKCSRSLEKQLVLNQCIYNFDNVWEINTDFLNQMAIKDITLTVGAIRSNCTHLQFINNFKSVILTLQQSRFKFIGGISFPIGADITFLNFDIIIFQQFYYVLTCENWQLTIQNMDKPISIMIQNSNFQGQLNLESSFKISLPQYNDLILNNITITNLHLKNTIFIQYFSNMREARISITQLRIENCTFENTTIFKFMNHLFPILIRDIEISNSNFTQSTFLQINFTNNFWNKLTLIKVENCIFQFSTFIQNIGEENLEVSQVNIFKNIFLSSLFIETSQQATLTGFAIKKNVFTNSTFFQSINNLESQFVLNFFFQEFEINFNDFQQSKVIHILEWKKNKYHINVENFTQTDYYIDSLTQNENDSQTHLYDFQCFYISINNFKVQNIQNYQYFKIYQSKIVIFTNIIFQNQEQKFKISAIHTCNMQGIVNSPIYMQIIGCSEINLHNISIINQSTINNAIIQIRSDGQVKSLSQEIIKISSIYFMSNILLKYYSVNFFSLFVIYSERAQQIYIQDLTFQENFFHQIIDDPSQMSAGLFYLNSLQSSLYIDNLTCQYNSLTNSSYSFISLNSLVITIKGLQITHHNFQTPKIWQKYYQISLDPIFTQEDIHNIIDSIFRIKTVRGVLQITTSQLIISNINISNVYAQSSAALFIQTQGQGIIHIHNLQILNVYVMLLQTDSINGCITISSVTSLLKLKLQNILFQEIYNRLGSAIFTIEPSINQNEIILQNITINNCFSLMNLLMKIEFSISFDQKNLVVLKDVRIYQNQYHLGLYLQLIDFPSSSEIRQIREESAIINLLSCSLKIHNFQVLGILIPPFLVIKDAKILIIKSLYIQEVKVLYQQRFIQISLSKTSLPIVIIEDFVLNKNVLLIQFYDESEYHQTKLKYIFSHKIEQCQVSSKIQQTLILDKRIIFFFYLLRVDYFEMTQGSFIFIDAVNQFQKIFFRQIEMRNNHWENADSLIYIQQMVPGRIQVTQLTCYQNEFEQFGCLAIIFKEDSEISKQLTTIKDSKFIQNTGSSYGGGLYLQQSSLKLVNALFLRNSASFFGGAVFLSQVSNFSFSYTNIIGNTAESGGGIYINHSLSHLNETNFFKSFILFNTGPGLFNNLIEDPSCLKLLINNQEMNSIINIETDGNKIYQLNLKKYKFIEQSKTVETNFLFLPSNQIIQNYKRFNETTLVFESYIEQFSLIFLNSLGENLISNSKTAYDCQLLTREISENIQEVQQSYKFMKNLSFIDEFTIDLRDINIVFDPYQSEDKFLQLLFVCQLKNFFDKNLYYQINAKTFKCQLGKFYTNNGCQPCESNYGFYSVEYNVVKCSVFDLNKLEKTTSNQLKLREGYWRPHYQSDLIEQCFKNKKSCIGGWKVNNDLCIKGHIGGLCEECDSFNIRENGNFVKISNTECGNCDNISSFLPFFFILIWSFISIMFTLRSIRNKNKQFVILKTTTKLYPILFKLTQEFQSIFFKMLLNYLWLFSVIFSFNTSFIFPFETIDSISSPIFQMAINLDCKLIHLGHNPLIYTRLIITIIFLAVQFIFIIIGFYVHFYVQKKKFDYSIISNILIYLYVSNQTQLIKSLGSFVAIRKISGIDYVQGDVTLLYHDKFHMNWIYSIILPSLILAGLIIPFFLLFVLVSNKNNFFKPNFRKHFAYLFNEYNVDCSYWEQMKILQRSIIIIIITYFEIDIYIKASLMSLTLIAYNIYFLNRKPYIIQNLNNLDFESCSIILISIFIATVEYISQQNNNTILSAILQSLLLIIFLRICYCFISRIIYFYYKNYKISLLHLISNFSFKIIQKYNLFRLSEKIIFNKSNEKREIEKILLETKRVQKLVIQVTEKILKFYKCINLKYNEGLKQNNEIIHERYYKKMKYKLIFNYGKPFQN